MKDTNMDAMPGGEGTSVLGWGVTAGVGVTAEVGFTARVRAMLEWRVTSGGGGHF